MGDAILGTVVRHVRVLAAARGNPTDADLLQAFVRGRDEAAFAALVRRHGPMVWNLCGRLLGHRQDAEDAFQATFLILARKAATVRKGMALASWLYGAAYRTAQSIRRAAARRRIHEGRARAATPRNPAAELAWREVQELLDEEVQRLAEKYRAVFVLCCLESKSRAEAARALGLKEGTVSSRLDEARKRLRHRLARRGVTLSAVLAGLALTPRSVPAALVAAAVSAPARGEAGMVSGTVAALVKEGAKAMAAGPRTVAAVLVLTLGVLAGGAGLVAWRPASAEPPDPPRRDSPMPPEPKAAEARAGRDLPGDPLPHGAIARLGTVRFRHGSTVMGLAFLPDGKTLLSGSYDKTLRLWDLASGSELWRQATDRGSIFDLCTSRDGKTVAAVDMGTVMVGRPGGLALPRLAIKPVELHTCVALSPDGKTLAAGCWDLNAGSHTVRVWDWAEARQVCECKGHKGKVRRVAFSPDGKTLATAGDEAMVRLWEVATGKETLRLEGTRAVLGLAFAPDGKTLAAGGEEGKLRRWELPSGKALPPLGDFGLEIEAVAFSPDGKAVASGVNGLIILWDPQTGKERCRVWSDATALAFSPDGKTLATGGHLGTIRLWDAATGKERLPAAGGHQGPVRQVAVSADGRVAATAGGDRRIRLWDVVAGRELRRLENSVQWAVALSADGKTAAADGFLWDADTGKVRARFGDPRYTAQFLALSPDGRTLATATRDDPAANRGRMVRLRDAATGKELRSFGERPVHSLAYSPDGKALAAGNRDGTIDLWDTGTGREVRRLTGHRREVEAVAFSPDGTALASGSFDGDLFLWDVAGGRKRDSLLRPRGEKRSVLALAFSFSGKALAVAEGFGPAEGASISLWELATGQVRLELAGHQGDVNALAFARDGRTLVSGSADTTALVWDVAAPPRKAPSLETAWADLGAADAADAYRAACTLAKSPGGVKFLGRLPPARAADGRRIAALVQGLDSDEFRQRESAYEELGKLKEGAEPALREALEAKPSPEVQRRLGELLAKLAEEWLRTRRAVEALELAGTPEARQVLESLARGAAGARLTREARASLDRLTDDRTASAP